MNPSISSRRSVFDRFSRAVSHMAGRPTAFLAAAAIVVAWACAGPFFGFSDSWNLVINSITTIVTFLMVFLIQSTQNRDTAAMQVKLDELIRATRGAKEILLDLEELNEDELERLHEEYEKRAERARNRLAARRKK